MEKLRKVDNMGYISIFQGNPDTLEVDLLIKQNFELPMKENQNNNLFENGGETFEQEFRDKLNDSTRNKNCSAEILEINSHRLPAKKVGIIIHDLRGKYSEKKMKTEEIYEKNFRKNEKDNAKTIFLPIVGFGAKEETKPAKQTK